MKKNWWNETKKKSLRCLWLKPERQGEFLSIRSFSISVRVCVWERARQSLNAMNEKIFNHDRHQVFSVHNEFLIFIKSILISNIWNFCFSFLPLVFSKFQCLFKWKLFFFLSFIYFCFTYIWLPDPWRTRLYFFFTQEHHHLTNEKKNLSSSSIVNWID